MTCPMPKGWIELSDGTCDLRWIIEGGIFTPGSPCGVILPRVGGDVGHLQPPAVGGGTTGGVPTAGVMLKATRA